MRGRITRRDFGRLAGAAVLATTYVRRARAAAPRIVVVGGGAGGAVAAGLLARSGAAVDVTLVEPKRIYTTCFFSNHAITALRSLESLTHNYHALEALDRLTLVRDRALAVDPATRTLRLAGGDTLGYDRLIVSPGIDFRWDAIDGYGADAARIMLHAWEAGMQTVLLRRQLEAMEDGGVFLIAPPENPYRCPTAPYERVSLVAHYFRQAKPKSRIIILDAKDSFPLQALFEEGWARFYPGMIEVIPAEFAGGVQAVDTEAGTVMSLDDTFRPAVANIIPPQRAGAIAATSGLTDDSGWCPVQASDFQSTLAPGVHVIGDAAIADPMPKAAYAAVRQAELCAGAIVEAITGKRAAAGDLGGACWTSLAPGHAVREDAAFAVTGGVIERTALDISATGEDDAVRAATAAAGEDWYRAITATMFG